VTSKAQGTGLGLSFVKKVIEDQGGKIEYLTRALGPGEKGPAGACFEIILPQQEENAAVGSSLANGFRGDLNV
jgi:nitrogen fixation/metabolism regulation signal transduction histidine kinase